MGRPPEGRFLEWFSRGIRAWNAWQKQRTLNVKGSMERKRLRLDGRLERREKKCQAVKPEANQAQPRRLIALMRMFLG
jgi:hypothetical protein